MSKSNYIFISYSKEDRKLAIALCQFLEERRLRCWMAPRDINPGENYAESIIEAIHMSCIMVLIFSNHSNKSKHVKNEVERGFNSQLIIIPFRIENILPAYSLEYFLSSTHWLDAVEEKPENYFEEVYRNCSLMINNTTQNEPVINVHPFKKSNSKIKTVFWVFPVCFVLILFVVFYFTQKKDSIINKAVATNRDSTSAGPIHTTANNTVALTKDTTTVMEPATPGTGKKLIKKGENTTVISQKVVEKKTANQIPPTETSLSATNLSEEMKLINGSTYEASKTTDELMFTAILNNKLSFTGSIGEYPVSGTLKLSHNRNFTIIESVNTKGDLIFSENADEINGTFYIKTSEAAHSFTLIKKQ